MRMMALKDVLQYLAVGRTKFHELRKRHSFPAPALRVGRLQRWDVRDIDSWIEQQRAACSDLPPQPAAQG